MQASSPGRSCSSPARAGGAALVVLLLLKVVGIQGNVIAVASQLDHDLGTNSGAAYVFSL